LAKSKTTMGKLQVAFTQSALKLIVIDECHCCRCLHLHGWI
jgi:hypothetical protein